MSLDDIRAEAVRSRAFNRASETQLTKVIDLIDDLIFAMNEPEPTPEPDPEPTPEPEPVGDAPVYDPDVHRLVDDADMSAFSGFASGATPFIATYPRGRAIYPGNPDNHDLMAPGTPEAVEAAGIVTVGDGRLRLRYGGPTGAADILTGPSLFEGGPVTDLSATVRFRTTPGANPAAANSSSVKGFMFFDDFPRRFELRPANLRYGGSRWDTPRWTPGGGWPENSLTGVDFFQTPDGFPPAWHLYADGEEHEFAIELHAGVDVTRRGYRYWLDGVLIFDNVGRVPSVVDVFGQGVGVDWMGSPVQGGLAYTHSAPTEGFMVWGNFVNSAAAQSTPEFAVEFPRWRLWA